MHRDLLPGPWRLPVPGLLRRFPRRLPARLGDSYRRLEEVMADITRNSREIVYRAILAPGRPFDTWTVGDFRRFVRDCDAQGISGDTPVKRERNEYSFLGDGGYFTAERKAGLGPVPCTPDTTELR